MMVGGFGAPHSRKPLRKGDTSEPTNHDTSTVYELRKEPQICLSVSGMEGCHGTGCRVAGCGTCLILWENPPQGGKRLLSYCADSPLKGRDDVEHARPR